MKELFQKAGWSELSEEDFWIYFLNAYLGRPNVRCVNCNMPYDPLCSITVVTD